MKRTEMAVTAKDELLEAKREIIDILKTKLKIFEQDGNIQYSDNVTRNSKSWATDNNNNDNGDRAKKVLHKGIKECCEFIEIHGTNGAILNGTLQWMSIKRSMLPMLKKVYGEFVVTPFRERILKDRERQKQ